MKTDLKNEFISKGINQTLHKIYLQIDCEVDILTPFDSISKRITNQILIGEHIIVGNIPNTYYNLENINRDNAMEVIE